jgi:hypothetical protein
MKRRVFPPGNSFPPQTPYPPLDPAQDPAAGIPYFPPCTARSAPMREAIKTKIPSRSAPDAA